MTVGALIAIMWDETMRGQTEQNDDHGDFGTNPLLCGKTWRYGGPATQSVHIDEHGQLRTKQYGNTKVTCPECIEVLKMNGL